MFYNKKRAFFRDIIHNNNNKIYLALIVIMIAIIAIIGSHIINDAQDMNNSESQSASETSNQEASDAFSGEDNFAQSENVNQNDKELTDTAIFIYLDDKLLAVKSLDANKEYSSTIASAYCYAAADVYNMLGNEASICISTETVSNKKLWYNLYDSVYTQYYMPYNDLSIHAPLYSVSGDYNSIIPESYAAISENLDHISYGVTVTTNAAKWLYENIPLGIDVYIVKSADNINDENNLDAEYIIDNRLISIPKGFTSDPTDNNANSQWCEMEIDRIEGIGDKTRELGTIAYSIFSKDIDYLHQVYSDIKAYDTAGNDITSYIKLDFDLSGFAEEELSTRNYQGWLLPGQYPVTITLADMYGNYIYETVYLNIVDTTVPVINFNSEVTEINREQMASDEYIRSLVTITELRQLTGADVAYRIEEENGMATIYYSVADASGNIAELVVSLNIR